MFLLNASLTVVGIVALSAAFVPIVRMMRLIGSGRLRQGWTALSALIVAFIIGYAIFLWLCAGSVVGLMHVVVSLILSAGGAFVLIVSHLMYGTARDIGRLAALERDVILDPLTGIYNRRYLDARLVEEVARSKRSGSSLSTVMIDIDHFKSVNDTFGHQIGDTVIRKTAELIMSTCRANDTVARYGGEEIIVLAPDTTNGDAVELAERIRSIIAQSPSLVENQPVAVTVSTGVASLEAGETGPSLVQRADSALYRAKQQGRNRVCVAKHDANCIPAANRVLIAVG